MVNGDEIRDYLNAIRVELGNEWVAEADAIRLGHETLGHIARTHAITCYMRGTKVETCAEQIRKKLT